VAKTPYPIPSALSGLDSLDASGTFKKAFTISKDPGGVLAVRPGFYLMTAATGGGKSTTAIALAAALADAANSGIPTFYRSLDEVDSTAVAGTLSDPISLLTADSKTDANVAIYKRYMDSIDEWLRKDDRRAGIVDSMTGMFAVGANIVKAPAMKGGMTPGYLATCLSLNRLAKERGAMLVGVLNTSMFNLDVEALLGACDGHFDVTGVGTFTLNSRVMRSRTFSHSLDSSYIDFAKSIVQPHAASSSYVQSYEARSRDIGA
jgi:hypothetical protein